MIETVLRSNDISMVEDSIATFESFCQYQDTGALAAEQEFANQYREVVRLYADFADPNSSAHSKSVLSPQIAIRWRNAGLRAIKSVVGPEGLTDEGGNLLGVVLPVVLKNLYTGEEDMLVSLQLQLQDSEKKSLDLAPRRRESTTTVRTAGTAEGDPALASQSAADADRKAEMEARLLALGCLERIIVSGDSRSQIRVVTTVVLQFITSKSPLPDHGCGKTPELNSRGTWATSLIELVAKWCPVQVRFVILVTAMEILLDTKPTDLERSFTLVCMIDWLLKSPVNMIGLSVMDVLLGLLRFILRLQPSQPNSQINETVRSQLLILIQQCIGNLATHIYYNDQVADMIRTILHRIKRSGSSESSSTYTSDSQRDAPGPNAHSATLREETKFTFCAAKVTALKAIKSILIVANSRKFVAAAGIESRKRVGIHVWERTHWLLRDSERDVRYAYADAFLSWLKLETNKNDLRATVDAEKHSRSSPKRDSPTQSGKRALPANPNQREEAIAAQSNCLRLLHLAVYEIALESPTNHSELLLSHLLLVSLVENLGVNAARFGLPMILRLQDDMAAVDTLRTFAAHVNIGSLVYGYLWALTQKFNLETSKVGREIEIEIEKRKKQGAWLQNLRFPPLSLDNIAAGIEIQTEPGSNNAFPLAPFRTVEELVSLVEQAYNSSMTSPAQSPPSSPGRGFSGPVLSHISTVNPQTNSSLPATIKEQMLSTWSKEACLATVENDSTVTMSTNCGSRHGTMTLRNHNQSNGAVEGSPPSTNSQMSSRQSTPGYVSGAGVTFQESRRMSVPEDSGSLAHSSSRGCPVRVNELRRVLTFNKEAPSRRLSPLRGRLDPSSNSVISSSSESMVSCALTVSEAGDRVSIRAQPGSTKPEVATKPPGDGNQFDQKHFINAHPDDIPPVPPIPPSLSIIPGGYTNDSGRPLTAPTPQRRPSKSSTRSKSGVTTSPRNNNTKSLNKHKSRSSTGLAAVGDVNGPPFKLLSPSNTNGHYRYDAPSAMEGTLDPNERDDLWKLLDGVLSHHSVPENGDSAPSFAHLPHPGTRARGQRGPSGRRKINGIGRPPY